MTQNKKIGIITLNGNTNYGNRLQNYALEQFITKNFDAFSIETIKYDARDTSFYSIVKRMLKRKPKDILKLFKSNYKLRDNELNEMRINRFKSFSNKYLNETKNTYTKKNLPKEFYKNYDYFIVGSDQVWNPKNVYQDSFYFLQFAGENQQISYAASFAVDDIGKDKKYYKKWLNNFKNISVRETSGAKIIEDLTGKSVPVLVDPTLLLFKNEWLEIKNTHSKKPKTPYILTYFLGERKKEGLDLANKIAIENNLEIVSLYDNTNKYFDVDPSEFIDYINDARIILTDSFHGAVFSIIFNKNFITFKRGDTNSRIETLLSMFDLENRSVENCHPDNYFKTEYTKINDLRKLEINKSMDFLEKSFNVRGKNEK